VIEARLSHPDDLGGLPPIVCSHRIDADDTHKIPHPPREPFPTGAGAAARAESARLLGGDDGDDGRRLERPDVSCRGPCDRQSGRSVEPGRRSALAR
jgi:hypothetical protein